MPKRVSPLTARTLASTRPQRQTIELADGYLPGLRVRILASGKRTWSLNIHDSKGERRRFDLGSGLSLAQARRKGEALRLAIRDGADPTAERRAARQRTQAAKQGLGTLRHLLEIFFTEGPGARQRRAAKAKRLLGTVFAKALDKPALDIRRPELQLIVDRWRSAATASLAVRLVRPCLKWAEKRELMRVGISALEQPAPVRKRERFLARDELAAIWPHLVGMHGCVIKWLLWTGCRLNEAAGMTWEEISGDTWTIPASRSKNGRSRVVPLPKQALELLRGFQLSESQALVFPSNRGGLLSNWDRVTKRLQHLSKTSEWHRHDLRRTVATALGDLRFAPHIVSVVLGHAHTAEGATAVYARSRYHQEHREALQALADEIESLVTPVSNAVRFAVR